MPRISKKILAVFATCALCVLAEGRYGERYRPQFHFSPQMNWTNDPCGLVYAFGKYHLFFQHNPFANVWGHMSWGHAVSSDLVHWKQLPVAIQEDEKAAIFTGSSIFDATNTSGLCHSSQRGCIVSIYTGFTPKTDTALREADTEPRVQPRWLDVDEVRAQSRSRSRAQRYSRPESVLVCAGEILGDGYCPGER